MPFFIVHVSGPPSSKRVLTDHDSFDSSDEAEEAAQSRWPDGDYFIVEAEARDQAAGIAIAESRTLD